MPDPREPDISREDDPLTGLVVARRTADHAADIIENLDALVAGLDRLLACYRTGGTPSGALLDRIGECRRRRQELLHE